jgi:hypothetical protein
MDAIARPAYAAIDIRLEMTGRSYVGRDVDEMRRGR